MVLRFFLKSKQPPEVAESAASAGLRERGATVDFDQDGEPTAVQIDHTATSEDIELLLQCPRLEQLQLNWCYDISDDELEKLAAAENLQVLEVPGANIDGRAFARFAGHARLETINVDGSGFTDIGLANVSAISGLKALFLRYTEITDSGLRLLSAPSLEVLHLDGTRITGEGLPALRAHRKLQVLSLPTGIRGEELEALHGFGSLRWLWLADPDIDVDSVNQLKETLNPMCSVGWRRAH